MNNTPEPQPAPLNQPLPENLTRKTPVWVWIALASVVALVAGILIGNVSKAPEIKEVEVTKEVTVEKVPDVCHSALVTYQDYSRNLESINYTYKEFVTALEGEFNGNPTPTSTYETYGMNIGLSQSLADEQADKLDTLITQCNQYLN